jgi:DNA-3-methyladenine glycosylase II
LEGFTPASYAGPEAAGGHLHLALIVDGTGEPAAVCVQEAPEGVSVEAATSGPADAMQAQVARILSLDVDAGEFQEIGRRDRVVGRLQARHPGLRPVLFMSPFEAAAWTIIGRRIRIAQAAAVKARMAEELGPAVEIHGQRLHAFPPPAGLRTLEQFAGLIGQKIAWLRGVADAAMAGLLDAARLRSIAPQDSVERLKTIPGIGDFSADLILVRGAGAPDHLPSHEPRLARAVRVAYGLDAEPSPEELTAIADTWRPFRSWVSFLLRAYLEEVTGGIASRR